MKAPNPKIVSINSTTQAFLFPDIAKYENVAQRVI